MDPPYDRGTLDRGIAIVHSAEAPSDDEEDSRKNPTIALRSNRNSGAIEPRWCVFHRGITSMIIRWRSLVDRDHDQLTIVARSWCDRGSFEAKFWAHSMPIRKPQCHQGGSLPRPIKFAPTTASIAHDLRANFSFKKRYILPLKTTF